MISRVSIFHTPWRRQLARDRSLSSPKIFEGASALARRGFPPTSVDFRYSGTGCHIIVISNPRRSQVCDGIFLGVVPSPRILHQGLDFPLVS